MSLNSFPVHWISFNQVIPAPLAKPEVRAVAPMYYTILLTDAYIEISEES